MDDWLLLSEPTKRIEEVTVNWLDQVRVGLVIQSLLTDWGAGSASRFILGPVDGIELESLGTQAPPRADSSSTSPTLNCLVFSGTAPTMSDLFLFLHSQKPQPAPPLPDSPPHQGLSRGRQFQ